MNKVIETRKLFSLFWKILEPHCFHYRYILTDYPTKHSENGEHDSELLDSSKTVVRKADPNTNPFAPNPNPKPFT